MTDGAKRRCSCSFIQYRNNHDGSRDFRIIGKAGCQKCHGIGIVRNCAKCDGCGMLPGSTICPRCNGNGVPADLASEWKTKK